MRHDPPAASILAAPAAPAAPAARAATAATPAPAIPGGGGGAVLRLAQELALKYLAGLADRPVGERVTLAELRDRLALPLSETGEDAAQVIRELAAGADPGLVGTAGPRYFGYVIGGSLPAALGADWLTSAWDQNAGIYSTSPAAAVVEEIAAAWLLDLLGLPATASVGFVTGCQMAHVTALAAARHALLARAGWDLADLGLDGAPPLRILAGAEAHVTVFRALRLLGFGSRSVERIGVDSQGRMDARKLARRLADEPGSGPRTLICAQLGDVNTGACDPLAEIAALARRHGSWLHVDGAFGMWAAASPRLRHLVEGVGLADSWATDAHKWLNVPYDSGLAVVADPVAHSAAMTTSAGYLQQHEGRDALDWVPEFSRRARGFAIYAALRSLGRRGVADMVERCCGHAAAMAARLAAEPGVEVMNDVVLNQVLVRFLPTPPDPRSADQLTRAIVRRVQRDGRCWLGGTVWHGVAAMRISVSNWSTSAADADTSAEAILDARRREVAGE